LIGELVAEANKDFIGQVGQAKTRKMLRVNFLFISVDLLKTQEKRQKAMRAI